MSVAELVIYGSPVSPFVRKVAASCAEKGVEYEIEAVNIFDPPEWFVEISPLKRIPVLRDRSISEEGQHGTIADSSAICGYVERKHPEPALYPHHPYAHGRALWIEEYADSHLVATAGMGIFRPVFFPMLAGNEPDLATARETWQGKMPAILDFLEASLGDQEYFVGEALSIADIAVTCGLMQVALVAHMNLGNWRGLAAHYDRMTARDSIAGPYSAAERFVRKTLPTPLNLD